GGKIRRGAAPFDRPPTSLLRPPPGMVRPIGGCVTMTRAQLRRANLPTRRLLVRRLRFILTMCIIGAITYALLDLVTLGAAALPSVAFKVLGISLSLLAMILIGQPWAVRRARLMAILVVSICYVFTATDRILSHGGEYHTTTVLFVGAALT